MSGAVYNEIDPFAAQWLRNLIMADLIAPGDVDERSILDVCPDDWRGYTQVHAFAGIGVWSHSLRRSGVPDSFPVWTGSCPCQPFSQAGQGGGFADERHLWPAWHHLIRELGPDIVLGEQVASKDGLAWLDLVSTDLEGAGYTFGATDQCVAGFGGPHIRQRLWFVGVRQPQGRQLDGSRDARRGRGEPADASVAGGLSDSQGVGRPGRQDDSDEGRGQRAFGPDGEAGGICEPSGVGLDGWRAGQKISESGPIISAGGPSDAERLPHHHQGLAFGSQSAIEPGALRIEGPAFGTNEPVRGFWSGADWIWFRDGKYRPVEPGTLPLAHGAPGRVGRLRAYGNAICAEVATGFIEEVLRLMP